MSRQNSLFCATTMLPMSVSSVTGKSTAQGHPFFVITTERSDGSFFTILLRLALTSETFDFRSLNSAARAAIQPASSDAVIAARFLPRTNSKSKGKEQAWSHLLHLG